MNAETKEIATTGEHLPATQPMDTMAILASAVERGVDTDYLEKLMTLHERNQANEARKAYFEAVSAAAVSPPIVIKDKFNMQYESYYSSMENTINTVSAHLGPFGLSHRFSFDQSDIISVTCILSHVAGHSERVTLSGPPDTSGKKNTLQQIKSTTTYLKLATFEAITGTASELGSCNDDGAAAVVEKRKKAKAARKPQNPATKEQIANLQEHLESDKLNVRDIDYIKANIDRMTELDATDILDTLRKEQAA